ncbi:ribonuclease H-like domain-containing protein, partial [Tanacetum coccineum]
WAMRFKWWWCLVESCWRLRMKVKTAKGKDTMPENINSLNKNGGRGNIFLRAILSILNAFVYVIQAIRTLICYVPIRVGRLLLKICVWYTTERVKAIVEAAKRAAGLIPEKESSKSSEILKSIVYGVIVVRFALACMIGGIFFLVYNIWEFKRSCNNERSSNETKKYREQLGRVNYFPLHAGFAILSFIVFGMIPPVSFLFLETSSKDLSMALVEVVSLLSVALLAIFKVSAINYKDYFQYVINLAYYLASAVSRSICSYLAGVRNKEQDGKYFTIQYGVANVVAETAWLRNLLRELHSPLSTATLVYCDNVSAVYMSANPVQHQRTKHIEIDIHFVRDMVTAGQVRVLHVPSRYQYADIFTKGLPSALFEEFRSSLSVRPSPAPTAGAY